MSGLTTTTRPHAVVLAAIAALAALLILGTVLAGLVGCSSTGRSRSARATTSDWNSATAHRSYCATR